MKFKIQSANRREKFKISAGYLLIESIIAITILIIGFLSMLSLLSNSVSLSRVVSDQFVANYLAMEGIEIVENIISGNIIQGNPWNQGLETPGDYQVNYNSVELNSYNNSFILFDNDSKLYNYDKGKETPFKRKITISYPNIYEIKVNSIVSWSGRKGINSEINLENHFFDWK